MNAMEKIIEIAEKAEANLECSVFGVRQHHRSVIVGEEIENSWSQMDDEEDYELDGSCALELVLDNGGEELEFLIDEVESANYQDGPIILVGGSGKEYGNDENEIIIADPVVLAIIKK